MPHLISGTGSAGYYRGKSNDHYVRNAGCEPWPFHVTTWTWGTGSLSLSLSLLTHKDLTWPPSLDQHENSVRRYKQSHTAGGSVTAAPSWGTISVELRTHTPSLRSLSEVHTPRRLSPESIRSPCEHVPHRTVYGGRKWELCRCLFLEEYISKMCRVCTMKYDTAVRDNKADLQRANWVDLRNYVR